MPIKKILIANRGEIALRVIRACKELGIKTVMVYSQADAESLPVRVADEAVCIGPSKAIQSYLNIPNLISAAEVKQVDAIHPGYGFLAENPQFAEVCESCNITFIGPSASVMEQMGDKATAKSIMKKAGVPVVPGSEGIVANEKDALKIASQIGYPVMVKASAGGGGKGMRIAHDEDELKSAMKTAMIEAQAAFGNPEVYIEKYIVSPRHIEIQVIGDSHGNVIHLGERECSIQRRHQKVLEEAPSPFLNAKMREEMGSSAVKAAKAVGYCGAGTVEFIVDQDHNYYFMEMNTRVQVEHPVTEMITGIDIVKEQILVADGKELSLKQEDVVFNGHAIEFRINAEDPDRDFMPSGGRIDFYSPPGGLGIRVDSHIYSGYVIPVFYDSLLGKLVVWGRDRNEAIMRAVRALDEYLIDGVPTTIGLHKKILQNEAFLKGDVNTDFIAKYFS